MFVDEVRIAVTAGAGGGGCVSFRREKFVPKGGPDGGDGGDGGSVFLTADESYNTLQHLAGRHHWKAQGGVNGAGKNKSGKDGKDIHIRVPPGTIIYDDRHNVAIKDLDQIGALVCVARGGQGGRGNTQFKNSVNQAPRYAEPGQPGEQKQLRLELKLIADVGLVGKPNAGKSTLLSRISAARPKIADYPFTTLYPCLGIVEMAGFRRFVMADIPGLIEGAHEGAGLGDEFLRHIERTRLLVHIVDIHPLEGDPVEDYRAIRKEIKLYSPALARKAHIVAANKMDLTGADEAIERFRKAVKVRVVPISAVTGKGLDKLTDAIWRMLNPAEE
ncbi:MAG: GTPase ObgE [Planctomycetes bacterium]|nr:GTPase ObgE [Planctomycetota bacterium]